MSKCDMEAVLPTSSLSSFSVAKERARDKVYYDHLQTFYCNCSFIPKGYSAGVIDPEECGYEVRKSETRGERLEWEHVMPAATFGNYRDCWVNGDPDCARKGRACCGKVDEQFGIAERDLHNLVPSVGELNGDRKDYPFGIIEGEPREYGKCDFEVQYGEHAKAEPTEAVRGDIARIWLYMQKTYDAPISEEELQILREWHFADPVSDWEIERDGRICEIQGNSNPFISGITKVEYAVEEGL
jgi:deoxyribonuclease I